MKPEIEINHHTTNYVPYSLGQFRGFFNVPCNLCNTEDVGNGAHGPYLRRLERLTICRCNYKGSTFTSVIFRPWILVQSGAWTLMTACTADLSPNNWATLVVEDKNSPGTVQMSYLIYLWGKLRVLQLLQGLFKCEWTMQKLEEQNHPV